MLLDGAVRATGRSRPRRAEHPDPGDGDAREGGRRLRDHRRSSRPHRQDPGGEPAGLRDGGGHREERLSRLQAAEREDHARQEARGIGRANSRRRAPRGTSPRAGRRTAPWTSACGGVVWCLALSNRARHGAVCGADRAAGARRRRR